MVSLRVSLAAIYAVAATVLAATPPPIRSTSPIVTLDRGTFIGTTANGINKFLGIPFAQPPSVVDFGSALSSLTDPPNRQSWRPALPSAQTVWLLRWQTQCHCVRSYMPPTSSPAGASGRAT